MSSTGLFHLNDSSATNNLAQKIKQKTYSKSCETPVGFGSLSDWYFRSNKLLVLDGYYERPCSFKRDKIKVQAAYFWLIKNEFIVIPQIIKVEHFEYFSTYTQKEPGLQNRNFSSSKKRTSLKIRELETGCISLNSFLRGKERENSLLQSWKEYWIVGKVSCLISRSVGQEIYLLLKFNFIVENIWVMEVWGTMEIM